MLALTLGIAATYETRWFPQTLDHFNRLGSSSKWPHRYLFDGSHWDGRGALANGCRGPILFYTGNEGPIDAFWGSNGFMTEVLAPRLGALLVFGEERYYGESLPFPYLDNSPHSTPCVHL